METQTIKQLQKTANLVRQGVIEGTFCAKSGHPGGSLSIADTLAYLYEIQMRFDPKNPHWEERDRLVLSKGHTARHSIQFWRQRAFLLGKSSPICAMWARFCRGTRI